MVRHAKTDDLDKIKTLVNAIQNNKDQIDDLCREFETIDPKSHKGKFAE